MTVTRIGGCRCCNIGSSSSSSEALVPCDNACCFGDQVELVWEWTYSAGYCDQGSECHWDGATCTDEQQEIKCTAKYSYCYTSGDYVTYGFVDGDVESQQRFWPNGAPSSDITGPHCTDGVVTDPPPGGWPLVVVDPVQHGYTMFIVYQISTGIVSFTVPSRFGVSLMPLASNQNGDCGGADFESLGPCTNACRFLNKSYRWYLQGNNAVINSSGDCELA